MDLEQELLDQSNADLVKMLLKHIPKGEILVAAVTMKMGSKGVGFYPAVGSLSKKILSLIKRGPIHYEGFVVKK